MSESFTSPALLAFSGLPGVGKSTLAARLARQRRCAYLRVDTVEAALLNAGFQATVEGYAVVYALAGDNLALGLDVVVDVVNPLALTRTAWAEAARRAGARLVNIEVVCSDEAEHRRRVAGRAAGGANREGAWNPADWAAVERSRASFEPWAGPRVVMDTAGWDEDAAFAVLLAELERDAR